MDADKGFNFSNADDAFVCQKKNHFQVINNEIIISNVIRTLRKCMFYRIVYLICQGKVINRS